MQVTSASENGQTLRVQGQHDADQSKEHLRDAQALELLQQLHIGRHQLLDEGDGVVAPLVVTLGQADKCGRA